MYGLTVHCPGISVSGNWRITFGIERGEITNLDLEDYH
jgi:plasmid maintenance system killer protein